jgi:hypothetical protein
MPIDDFSNIISDTFGRLLDIYQMKDWGMDFEDFKKEFIKEFQILSPSWTIEEEE